MADICTILSAHVITALGDGLDVTWTEMLRKVCGLQPMTRFSQDLYGTAVAGEIPQEVMDSLPCPAEGAAYRLSRHSTARALEGLSIDPKRTGLVLSTTKAEITALEASLGDPKVPLDPRYDPYRMARDLAAVHGLEGPVFALSNACASGLIAVAQGARLLASGAAETMVVVGVDTLSPFILAGFSSLGALSKTPCTPFDAQRTGLSLGEGAGTLVLSRNSDAGPAHLGVVSGWGIANDAHHLTGPSRTGEGLKRAVSQALSGAALSVEDVHYINAHGTGTPFNDETEAVAVSGLFGDNPPPLTSMKGYFGHTLGAAGVIEAALTLKVLAERKVPASLGMTELGVTKPIHVPGDHLDLETAEAAITMKAGFGGINGAIALTRGRH